MADHEPIPDRAWFTPLLNRIADVAGERAALLLGREKAGQQIYIPSKITCDHWLAELVGLEAATALSEIWKDQKIVLPRSLDGQLRDRAATIAEMHNKGYSLNTIVRLTGLSRTTVRTHVGRLKDDRQGNLF